MKTLDMSSGKSDPYFSDLYRISSASTDHYKKRLDHVIGMFFEKYPSCDKNDLTLFSSPGRLELTGNHSDHQGGVVLTGTVNADILACAAVNDTDMVNIFSEGYAPVSVDQRDTGKKTAEINTTAALVRGMIKAIKDKGYPVNGFNVYAVSDVPGGLGMSSSAAFEVLIGVILNTLFCDNKLTDEEIAYAGMYAEREYFGKPCGLMDQMACIKGGINVFSFKDPEKPEITPVHFDLNDAGIDMIVTDTGTDHADLSEEFNAIPREMYCVANVLGGERLCDIPEEMFYDNICLVRAKAGDRAVMRAMHWYEEIKRVKEQGESLVKGDIDRFLENVNASGYSSFMYLQNIDNYKDPVYQPVALSLAYAHHVLKGRGAVRVQGGGFAGSIIAFVPSDVSSEYIDKMDRLLGKGACRKVHIRPAGAIRFII